MGSILTKPVIDLSYKRETSPNFRFERFCKYNSHIYLYRHIYTDELYSSSKYPYNEPTWNNTKLKQSFTLIKPLFTWYDLMDSLECNPKLYIDQSCFI